MSRPDPAQTEAVGDVADEQPQGRRDSAVGPTDPLVGTTLYDRYKVLRRVGEGGMGIVYEAEHVLIEKRVALKVLKDDFSSRPDVVERFRQEAKSASRIGHEHIVDISDFGETPSGQSYFVMEFLEGQDLATVLGREGTLEPGRAVEIALQCCRALGAAHDKGIVHRDMKPENIFMVRRDDGRDFVKIVDFGIAKMTEVDGPGEGKKLTKTGMIFGTPEYMSPEQASGKPLDHRVDVYAMGVILFEMLAGRVPFVGDTFMGILTQHLFEPPPTLQQVNATVRCPETLEAIIYTCLAKTADERYPSMAALADALRAASDEVAAGGYQKSVGTLAGFGRTRTPISKPPETVDLGRPTGITAIADAVGGRSRIVLVGAAVLAFGGALGIGAWVASNRDDGTARAAADATAPADTPPEAAAVADAPAPGGDAPEAAPGVAEGAAPSPRRQPPRGADTPRPRALRVTVTTSPAGASVRSNGLEVCTETPCEFEAAEGEALRIEARKRGYTSARTEFTPFARDRSLTLALEPVRRRPPAGSPGGGPAPDPNAPTVEDLKTPDF